MRSFTFRAGLLLLLLPSTSAAFAAVTSHATPADLPGIVLFRGIFGRGIPGILSWQRTGGGAQCANYGTPSINRRLRGNLVIVRVKGVRAGRFDLPASELPSLPLQGCELTHQRLLTLGVDDYYGYTFYVPRDWRTGNTAFWGIATAQFHFQNIWGSPIEFQLHDNHMTLAVSTGPCRKYYTTPTPGCRWHSNADNPDGRPGDFGRLYVVPPPMSKGVWHEVIMHVHWAADGSGHIEVWHRIKGSTRWKRTVDLQGLPTVQWDVTKGCCEPIAVDKIGAYRGLARRPVSVWEANFMIGTSFPAVAATLPG